MLAANSNETTIKQQQQQHQLQDTNQLDLYQQQAASSNAHRYDHRREPQIVSPILYRPTLISTIAHHHLLHHQHHHHHHHHDHQQQQQQQQHHQRHHEHAKIGRSPSERIQQLYYNNNNNQQSTSVNLSNASALLSNRFIAYAKQSAYHDAISYAPTQPLSSSSSAATCHNNNSTTASNGGALVKISPTAHKLRLQHQKRLYSLCPTQHQIDIRYRRYFQNRTYCDLISRCGQKGLAIDNKLPGQQQLYHHHTAAHGGGEAGSAWPHHSSIEMLDILRSLRSLLKISRIHTDGNIFRLHYSLTVIILMAFCIIITTKQYVGEPIDCIRAEGIDKSIINTYCWIHTTYSIPRAFNKKVGVDVPHPGVDNTNNPSEFQHHKYYQWVCFVLFVQAATFYIPRYLWKLWEAGKVEAVVMHLDVGVGFEPDLTLKKQAIVDYLYHSSGHHDWYAARYYFCECLSFVNVVAQMFLLNLFFEGEFFRYGLNVIEFTQLDQEDRVDPMIKIFPRVTKCKFYKYGPSANIETIDALCLLPLNIINEKIYIFLWFWFILLAILTFFMLIFGLIIIACPPVRVYMLNLRFRMSQLNHLHIIVRKSSIGDWFLLYLLGKNMDSYIFKDVIVDLAQRYMSKGKESDQRMLA